VKTIAEPCTRPRTTAAPRASHGEQLEARAVRLDGAGAEQHLRAVRAVDREPAIFPAGRLAGPS
jgi:hypothetical protein